MNKKILIALIVTIILTLIIGIALIILNNLNKNTSDSNITEKEYEEILLENVHVFGYISIDDEYTITIGKNYGDTDEYKCTADNIELLCCTKEYDEVSINIYYIEDKDTKTIVKYELYNNETNEKMENIYDEEDLRKELGYYTEGTYEEELTLIALDDTYGFGVDSENSDMTYIYYTYTFENKKGKTLEMEYKKYQNSEFDPTSFKENKKYIVKFDVKKGSLYYEYIITDIEENMDDEQQETQEFDEETYANVADSWVGTYTNGDITVKLIRRGKIRLDYTMPGISGIFDTASEEKLTDKEDSFGVTNSIKIERIQNGVKITASSTDSESILNECNGEYTLQEFSKSNWDGIYTNGDKSITISEINENELYITMDTPQLLNYQINLDGSAFAGNSNYSEREINYEFKIADTKKLKITKTTYGIEVVSSSTDKSDLLNSMSGTYYKQ